MIDKIKPTIAIGAEMRLIFSETESIECAWIFFGDLNGYEILIAQPVDNQDFCGKSAHWRPYISFRFTLRLEKPITSSTAEQHEKDDDDYPFTLAPINQLLPYFFRRGEIAFRYDGESEKETRSVETTSAPCHGENQALSFGEHVHLGDIVEKDDFVFVCVNDGVMPSQGMTFTREIKGYTAYLQHLLRKSFRG